VVNQPWSQRGEMTWPWVTAPNMAFSRVVANIEGRRIRERESWGTPTPAVSTVEGYPADSSARDISTERCLS